MTIPNLITALNLFCGFFSVILTFSHYNLFAAWLIVFAAIFDALDGQLARILKKESDFGKQMDSLADVISSGLAPAVLIYDVFFLSFKWAILFSFLYVLFVSFRLANFNVTTADGKTCKYYIGLPAPAAALTLAGLVILCSWKPLQFFGYLPFLLIPLICYLMTSSHRYDCFPRLRWKERGKNRTKIIIVAVSLLLVGVTKGLFLFPVMCFYIILGIVLNKRRS